MDRQPATLDHAGIAARVPHHGRMCLLDALLRWSPDELVCSASGHADPAHPLRTASGLLAPCAIEYAGQAMALHGALLAPPAGRPAAGYLASVRGVRCHVPRLDTLAGPLQVRAVRLAGEGAQVLYRFELHDAAGALAAEGRATVVLQAATPPDAAGAPP